MIDISTLPKTAPLRYIMENIPKKCDSTGPFFLPVILQYSNADVARYVDCAVQSGPAAAPTKK